MRGFRLILSAATVMVTVCPPGWRGEFDFKVAFAPDHFRGRQVGSVGSRWCPPDRPRQRSARRRQSYRSAYRAHPALAAETVMSPTVSGEQRIGADHLRGLLYPIVASAEIGKEVFAVGVGHPVSWQRVAAHAGSKTASPSSQIQIDRGANHFFAGGQAIARRIDKDEPVDSAQVASPSRPGLRVVP